MYFRTKYLHAAEIAKALGQKHTVLPKFRIQYFDPLLPREKLVDQELYTYGIPVILMTKTDNVRRPGKTDYEPMDNSFYQFKFLKTLREAYIGTRSRVISPKISKRCPPRPSEATINPWGRLTTSTSRTPSTISMARPRSGRVRMLRICTICY